MKKYYYLSTILLMAASAHGQMIFDGVMMPGKRLAVGAFYGGDEWKKYWEGTLLRENQNVGTVTTQAVVLMAMYGLTDKVSLIAMAPYLTTNASSGTLHGQQGIQDLTIGGKYNFFKQSMGPGTFSTIVAGTFSTPMTKYTPDFLPLSIGLSSTNLSGRFTMNYTIDKGWFINASNAYTWRSNVKLDRPSYFVDNTYYASEEVKMYDVYDFNIDLGYRKNGLMANITYVQQNTLGGGDIRRQDMPFVSNMMNFSKIGEMGMYDLPKPKNLTVRASYHYVIAGRNVGQSGAWMAGLLYTLNFAKAQ